MDINLCRLALLRASSNSTYLPFLFSFSCQNVADIKKLKAVGICTIKGIQMTTRRRLIAIKGFSEAKVDKIKEACAKIDQNSFLTALQVSEKRKEVFKITTGSKEFE